MRRAPVRAELVTQYEDLKWFATKFLNGNFGLLMVIGPPGVGKSEVFKRSAGNQVRWVEGRATPFSVYRTLYEHRATPDLKIVLNDAQSLWEGSADQRGPGISLLKQLCETSDTKTICWDSKAADDAGMERSFFLTCKVAIIANDWLPRGVHVEAVEDRAHKLHFDPTAAEVHRYVGEWFRDREIYDFVGENIDLITRPSIREFYMLAKERKEAGPRPSGENWKDFVLKQTQLRDTALAVARLLADPRFDSMQEREQEFTRHGWGSRSTFYDHVRRLRERQWGGALAR